MVRGERDGGDGRGGQGMNMLPKKCETVRSPQGGIVWMEMKLVMSEAMNESILFSQSDMGVDGCHWAC